MQLLLVKVHHVVIDFSLAHHLIFFFFFTLVIVFFAFNLLVFLFFWLRLFLNLLFHSFDTLVLNFVLIAFLIFTLHRILVDLVHVLLLLLDGLRDSNLLLRIKLVEIL